MIHITINTGNIEEIMQPCLFTIEKSMEEGNLLKPYDRYSIGKVFGEEDWMYFDLYLDGEHITANLVTSSGKGWSNLVSFYGMIYGAPSPIEKPPVAPWLATVILPSPKIFESMIAARIEQAIALSGME